MEIKRENTHFQPITIRIETEEELRVLLACVNQSMSGLEELFVDMCFDIPTSEHNEICVELYNTLNKYFEE